MYWTNMQGDRLILSFRHFFSWKVYPEISSLMTGLMTSLVVISYWSIDLELKEYYEEKEED